MKTIKKTNAFENDYYLLVFQAIKHELGWAQNKCLEDREIYQTPKGDIEILEEEPENPAYKIIINYAGVGPYEKYKTAVLYATFI